MRAVVAGQADRGAGWKVVWEFKDIPNCGTSKSVDTLIFVTNDTDVVSRCGELKQNLFLDVVGVLVLIDEHIFDALADLRADGGILQQLMEEVLLVSEV